MNKIKDRKLIIKMMHVYERIKLFV